MQPKRPRCDDVPGRPATPPTWTLSPLLAPELTSVEVPVVDVWVGVLTDRRHTSRLIRELSARSPVAQLLHLKRCAGDRIILALATGSADACVDRLVADGVNLTGLQEATDDRPEDKVANPERSDEIQVPKRCLEGQNDAIQGSDSSGVHRILVYRQSVPAQKPRSRFQYDAAFSLWPTNFHEDRRLERLLAGTEFSPAQLSTLGAVMARCVATGQGVGAAAAVVDPCTGAVLAVRRDARNAHPLKHAVMEVVDAIARLQGGGAWRDDVDEDVERVGVDHEEAARPCEPLESVLAHRKRGRPKDGGDEEVELSDVLLDRRHTELDTTGTQEGTEKGEVAEGKTTKLDLTCAAREPPSDMQDGVQDGVQDGGQAVPPSGAKTGPYLCTGYDVFVTREPCAMCAMALVHARARRVFFGCASPDGALRSRAQLHLLRNLNHHYEAYGGVMERECRELWEHREA